MRRVRVTSLRVDGILLGENEGVVHELTVTTRIDRDTIHELYELHCPWFFTGGEHCACQSRCHGNTSPRDSWNFSMFNSSNCVFDNKREINAVEKRVDLLSRLR